jgi:hypothetical protein
MGLGSGIRDPEKIYSGSRGQKGTGSRIRIRNTVAKQKNILQKERQGTDSKRETWYGTGKVTERQNDEWMMIQDNNLPIDKQKHSQKIRGGKLNCRWQPNLKETFVS